MTRLATLRRIFPTFTAPARWIGRSRRRIWVASLLALAIVLGPPLWWATQLVLLPDIGPPFDAAAFRATALPDEKNAYRVYDRAWEKYQPLAHFYKPAPNTLLDTMARWPVAAPAARHWAEANRAALALYRQGSELSDAMDEPPEFGKNHDEQWGRSLELWMFLQLAFLEASRLEANGDMAGAWGWYRANLRAIHLVSRNATVERRGRAQGWQKTLNPRVTDWAADPRTTPDLIRRALDDVIACEALAPSESYTLKAEYLDVDRLLDDDEGPAQALSRSAAPVITFFDWQLSPNQALALYESRRYVLREPERSRRVLRLVFANWLAYYDLPESSRPRPDLSADGVPDFFYPTTPQAPANARRMSTQDLARWLATCIDANILLGYWQLTAIRRTERSNHRDLVIGLATELYRRDHGGEPPNAAVLIGPYLKSLPPDFREIRDEAVPVFDISRD